MTVKQTALAVGVFLSVAAFNSNASLTSYTGDGGVGLVFSSISNVTWTQDANLFQTLANSYAGGYTAFVNTVIASVPEGKINDRRNYLSFS